MNLKSVLMVCALALATVKADVTESNNTCYQKKGMFLIARDDPSDSRYACLLPKNNGDERTKYCVNYDGRDLCYSPSLGNINYCDLKSREYNSRGCALGLGYLYNNIKSDDLKHQESRDTCYKSNGMFLEGVNDHTDYRFACLLPEKSGDSRTKYCVVYDDKPLCYAPDLGNMSYCDLKNKNYHSRGCAMGLGYLYNELKFEDKRHESSKKTCSQKRGYFLENRKEVSDRRFACLLPEKNGDSRTKYCVVYDDKPLCYAPDLGNMAYCDLSSPEYHSRGCALGLSALWSLRRN